MNDGMNTWEQKATENINKWGHQSVDLLALLMVEELGELTQAILQYKYLNPLENRNVEDDELKYNRIKSELDDLAALMYQMKWVLDGE